MSESSAAAAPESGSEIPTFEELEADPEIAALLEFEAAPRQNKRKDGWTPALQRQFVAWLAYTGSPNLAADIMGKSRHGVEKVYKSAGAESFQAAWDGAVALFEQRDAVCDPALAVRRPPMVDRRRKRGLQPAEGQVLNEFGEYEDEDSLDRRAADARDSISSKLLRCRRMYLAEISGSAGKRAAFEILTGYEINWDKAERLEPQIDEPYRDPNMREPDMLLTGENGWFGEFAHGPNKLAELRAALDRHHADNGLPAINWGEDKE
jgi:hypothetical protein